MSNNLLAAGSQPSRPMRFAPIHTNRWFTGLWTQRNPLRDAATPFLYEKFYAGSRFDSLIDGSNVELSAKLTLTRRPGNSVYNAASFNAPSRFYTLHTAGLDGPNTQAYLVLADVPNESAVYCINQGGKPSIATRLSTAGKTAFQEVGNTIYMAGSGFNADGGIFGFVQFNLPAWQPSFSYSLGQIIVDGSNLGSAHVQMVTAAGKSGTSFPSWNHGGGATNDGGVTWTDQGAALGHPFAYHAVGVATPSQPASVAPNGSGTPNTFWTPSYPWPGFFWPLLDNNGNIQITNASLGAPGRTGTVYPQFNYAVGGYTKDGSSAGNYVQWLCGGPPLGWQPNTVYQFQQIVVDSNNNLQQLTANSSGTPTGAAAPAWATVRGNTTSDGSGALLWTCCGPAQVVAQVGYRYCYAWHTKSGGVGTASDPTNATAFTGPILGISLNVNVTLQYSPDPAVDSVYIFRTPDGGTTLELLDIVANSVGGGNFIYNDTKPDYLLNILIQAPISHNNDRPPGGISCLAYHLNRLWGAVGSTVYYSRVYDGTAGNPLEAWPPTNSFVFPAPVTRMYANSLGLIVFTQNGIFIIAGMGTATDPLFWAPLVEGIGLLNFDAMTINGTVVYMLTADDQCIALHIESGVAEVGFPIGDQLATFSPTAAYLAWHTSGSDKALYVADGSTGWFRMNPTASPETGLTWSPKATIVGGVGAIGSVDTSPGVKTLLIGPAGTGPILKRDLSVYQDNGSNYTGFATVGSLVLALPGQLAALGFIAVECLRTPPGISVLLDEISGSFASLPTGVNEPPEFPASVSLNSQRYYFSQTALPAWCRHLQIKFSWGALNEANELLTYTIFGAHYQQD